LASSTAQASPASAAQTPLDALQPVKPVPIEEFLRDALPPWA
jgi:hypothetical protein